MHYIQNLDALRAIAVLMVMVQHWLPNWSINRYYDPGSDGVLLFFVLSGFLITRILLSQVNQGDNFKLIKSFYARRTLRLFPIYYLILGVLYALNFEAIRTEIFWHLSYTSNWLFLTQAQFSNGVSHFWSLSVEEQFYLFWPIVLILFSRKHFFTSCLVLIFIAKAAAFTYQCNETELWGISTIIAIEPLSIGAILARIESKHSHLFNKLPHDRIFQAITIILGVIIVAWPLISSFFENDILYLEQTVLSIFFVNIIWIATIKDKHSKWPWMRFGVFQKLGKWSYGIYLYHNLAQWMFAFIASLMGITMFQSQELNAIVYFLSTVLISKLSFDYVEAPLQKFKKYFRY